jgi:ATP-dependent DNA helicase PIF1
MSDYENIKQAISEGRNIFLTGPGGVGKSFYINKLKEEMGDTISITSTTGVSSFNLKAQTIHSFSGIGVMKRSDRIEDIMKKLKKNKLAFTKILECSLLVIDEISMLGQSYLEMLDKVFKKVRKNDITFGGIQVIFTGDFLQLPPVNDNFCFWSQIWEDLSFYTIYLTKMFRVADPIYTGMLERIRVAKHTPDDNKELYKRYFAFKKLEIDYSSNAIQPTFLYSKKCNVHEKNMEELEKNTNELLIFKALYTEIQNDYKLDKTDQLLYLKVGAQVMLNVNLDCEAGLVNGSRGIITGYSSENGGQLKIKFLNGTEMFFSRHETSVEEDGKLLYKVVQFPFILAYALSIHKVQGSTLDYAIIDIGYSVFESSMSYVALSRVRSLEGLFLQMYQPSKIFCNKEALEFYESIK